MTHDDADEHGENSDEPTPRERSLAAIRPHRFKPGKSGNPRGRPKKPTFTEIARRYLDAPAEDMDHLTRMEALVHALYARAMRGDNRAAAELLDRVDPKTHHERPDGIEPRVLKINLVEAKPPPGWSPPVEPKRLPAPVPAPFGGADRQPIG